MVRLAFWLAFWKRSAGARCTGRKHKRKQNCKGNLAQRGEKLKGGRGKTRSISKIERWSLRRVKLSTRKKPFGKLKYGNGDRRGLFWSKKCLLACIQTRLAKVIYSNFHCVAVKLSGKSAIFTICPKLLHGPWRKRKRWDGGNLQKSGIFFPRSVKRTRSKDFWLENAVNLGSDKCVRGEK